MHLLHNRFETDAASLTFLEGEVPAASKAWEIQAGCSKKENPPLHASESQSARSGDNASGRTRIMHCFIQSIFKTRSMRLRGMAG